MTLGEMIKKKREELGMTQQELANKLFVSRQTVCRWENGSRCPDLIMSKKIVLVLGISLDELITSDSLSEYMPAKEPMLDISCIKVMLTGLMLVVIGAFMISADVENHAYAAACFFSGIGIFILGLFIPWNSKPAQTDSDSLPQRTCPNCGRKHDFDYPKCPHCGKDYAEF